MKVTRFPFLSPGRLYPPLLAAARGKDPWYSFLLDSKSTPGPQCGQNNKIDKKSQSPSSVIKPATFRLLAQYLNQLSYSVLSSPFITFSYMSQVYAFPCSFINIIIPSMFQSSKSLFSSCFCPTIKCTSVLSMRATCSSI